MGAVAADDGRAACLAALAARLGVEPGGAGAADGRVECRGLDEVMDEFVEEHAQCHAFRDEPRRAAGQPDRYAQVFAALQRELCRTSWPPRHRQVSGSRSRTLRVLQCLRLLTRDPDLQAAFFERPPPDCEPGAAGAERRPAREQEAAAADAAPLAPAVSSRAPPPQHPAGGPSPTWEHYCQQQLAARAPPPACGAEAEAEGAGAAWGLLRLPPLEPLVVGRPAPSAVGSGGDSCLDCCAASSAPPLLRLLSELSGEYLAEADPADASGGHAADASAGTGLDARLGKLVTGLCIAEATAVLSRYASTADRQDALAKLGALDPLASLVAGGESDLLVLRCALEALVRLTAPCGAAPPRAPLAELAPRAALLPRCLVLTMCGEEVYEALAGQLLTQLLEAPQARAQLRRLGAVPALLAPIRDAAAAALPSEARRATCALRCCRQLARDHVELADPMAVQELLEHGALGSVLGLVRAGAAGGPNGEQAEVLAAALEALAQMCMDDECALVLRQYHSAGFLAVAGLLLDEPWRSAADASPGAEPDGASRPARHVRLAAARLLRFVFGVERNRRAFKRGFSAGVLTSFIDVGNYVWPLQAYVPFVGAVSALTEQEAEQVMSGLRSHGEQRRRKTADSPVPPDGAAAGREGSPDTDSSPLGGGRVVNGYELLECVGAGAFGRVHLARRRDGVPGEFALKEVTLTSLSESPQPPQAQPGAHEEAARDITSEVRLLRQLDHPNVVRYCDSFAAASPGAAATLWIVMEYCRGVSLQGFAGSARAKGLSRLPEEQTERILVQLCLALKYLHVEKDIAHRDLTPNNVLVNSHTLAVKIVDFGLARQKRSAAAASMMKTMVGTILYNSPEIVQSQPYSNKTDVWAMGCLLYKMATLGDPFQGTNPLAVARRIVECDYDRLDPSVHSQMLVTACERCLTVCPKMRPDTQEVFQLIMPAVVRYLEETQRAMARQQQPRGRPGDAAPPGTR